MRLIIMFFLILVCAPRGVFAEGPEGTILLKCGSGGCNYIKSGQESKANRISFSLQKGRALLSELKDLREQKNYSKLLEGKLEIKNRELELFRIQLDQAEKALKKLGIRAADLARLNRELVGKNQQLAEKVAKYKGERFKFMIIGFSIGAGVVLAGGIAVGVFLAYRPIP